MAWPWSGTESSPRRQLNQSTCLDSVVLAAISRTTVAALVQKLGACEIRPAVASKIVSSFASIATSQVVNAGKFTFPGVCMITTRQKPATKACKKTFLEER